MQADSTDHRKSDEDKKPGQSEGLMAHSAICKRLPPCQVCMAASSGYHFGILSCEACKSFFRRTKKLKLEYTCLSHEVGQCSLRQVKGSRPPCPACRFKKCVALGMSLNAAKKGRYSHAKRVETVRATTEYWLNQQNAGQQTHGESSRHQLPVTEGANQPVHFTEESLVRVKQEFPSGTDDCIGHTSSVPVDNESTLDAQYFANESVEIIDTAVDDSEDSWENDIAQIFGTQVSDNDEDMADMDKFIAIVDDAYDREQFVSKLFLSQIPDIMHTFLVEEHCRKKKYPVKSTITRERHMKVFCQTGIDLAGRIEAFREFAQDSEEVVKKTSSFCMMVPGFRSLSEEDRVNIFKVAELEQIITALYPVHFYDEGVCIFPSLRILPTTVLSKFFGDDIVEAVFKICKDIQELYLSRRENALFAALLFNNPVYCVTAEGKYICRILRNFTAKCFNKTLASHFQGEKLAEMLSRTLKILEKIPSLSRQFSRDTESIFFQKITA